MITKNKLFSRLVKIISNPPARARWWFGANLSTKFILSFTVIPSPRRHIPKYRERIHRNLVLLILGAGTFIYPRPVFGKIVLDRNKIYEKISRIFRGRISMGGKNPEMKVHSGGCVLDDRSAYDYMRTCLLENYGSLHPPSMPPFRSSRTRFYTRGEGRGVIERGGGSTQPSKLFRNGTVDSTKFPNLYPYNKDI